MTAWGEVRKINGQSTIAGMAEAQRRLIIDLKGDVCAEPQLRIFGKRPVLYLELNQSVVILQQASIAWADQAQMWFMTVQDLLELLHATGGAHFLQRSCRRAGIHVATATGCCAAVIPAPWPGLNRHGWTKGDREHQHGRQPALKEVFPA